MTEFSTALPDDPGDLEKWIEERENTTGSVKDHARAQIVWNNSESREKTEYALVYLHGFKATHGEGIPIHRRVAKAMGWNLYLSRLEGHGLDVPLPLKELQPSSFEKSALEALAIGEKIGRNVVIMGTSTGGSMGLYLAARDQTRTKIKALLLYAPLIKFYGRTQWFLGHRLTRKLMKFIPGQHYMISAELGSSDAEKEIWYSRYALQGALALGGFIQQWMNQDTFSKVECPVFTGYYYKNKRQQDKVVSVDAIKKMHIKIGTDSSHKILKNFPEAGSHVICSGLISRSFKQVEKETLKFLDQNLGLSGK